MRGKIPHIVQYQGSKRKLASQILQYVPEKFSRLIEPFSGVAAVSIAAASENRAERYIVNDINAPLIGMLREAIEEPEQLIDEYTKVWNAQFSYGEDHVRHFFEVRDRFNLGEETPANMLYLLARCVKGAVRYGKNGKFNQSPDKRRHGTPPSTLAENVFAISKLLKGRTQFFCCDYHDILKSATTGDIVYLDPPYQGVTNVRDNRYFSGVAFEEFAQAVSLLDKNNIDYLISYDGECGGKEYGETLPEHLHCERVLLNAGRSSQATLLGKNQTTFEALYISKNLLPVFHESLRKHGGMEARA